MIIGQLITDRRHHYSLQRSQAPIAVYPRIGWGHIV